MGGERLFKLSIFSYCNSVISTFNLNVLFHSIMGLSTLNVVHLTYSTNASLLKNFKAIGYLGSLSSCHETSRRFLRYGNSFPSTFPEVLLAHASQMTGQLSQSMQIRRARDSINAMLATIISESFTSP